jgi:ornithine--oxo-acid transaminase
MAPIAVSTSPTSNGSSSLKPTARSFHPTGTPDPSNYHASSSTAAIETEAQYAAHNYHPLPVVFARASGVSVWDPVRATSVLLTNSFLC